MKSPALLAHQAPDQNPRRKGASRMSTCASVLAATGSLLALVGGLRASEASRPPDIEPQTINVLVINFDPVLKTRQNLRLHAAMNWSDPWALTDRMVEAARDCSGGYVNYRVVEKIEHDGFTTFRDGFTYTEKAYLEVTAQVLLAGRGRNGLPSRARRRYSRTGKPCLRSVEM